ncbi:MAG TPA: hypothetical protein PK263_00710, partial [bacterium]|nr:hypothetical protein [bacterium]
HLLRGPEARLGILAPAFFLAPPADGPVMPPLLATTLIGSEATSPLVTALDPPARPWQAKPAKKPIPQQGKKKIKTSPQGELDLFLAP